MLIPVRTLYCRVILRLFVVLYVVFTATMYCRNVPTTVVVVYVVLEYESYVVCVDNIIIFHNVGWND